MFNTINIVISITVISIIIAIFRIASFWMSFPKLENWTAALYGIQLNSVQSK